MSHRTLIHHLTTEQPNQPERLLELLLAYVDDEEIADHIARLTRGRR